MTHVHYLGVLLFIGICAAGVSLGFKVKSAHFWRIFLATAATILFIYLAWDLWAISKKNWHFDSHQILNIFVLPKVPIEEVLFFIIVPLTTIVTYKALLRLTRWEANSK